MTANIPIVTAAAASAQRVDAQPLPLIEEVLEVDTVEVATGVVRVSKRVRVQEVTVDELLRDQRVEIERRPLGTRLADGEMPAIRREGETLIVPVIEEVLVTQKCLVLVEEVRITRVAGTHRDPRQVSLRREELSVERLAAGQSPSNESS